MPKPQPQQLFAHRVAITAKRLPGVTVCAFRFSPRAFLPFQFSSYILHDSSHPLHGRATAVYGARPQDRLWVYRYVNNMVAKAVVRSLCARRLKGGLGGALARAGLDAEGRVLVEGGKREEGGLEGQDLQQGLQGTLELFPEAALVNARAEEVDRQFDLVVKHLLARAGNRRGHRSDTP